MKQKYFFNIPGHTLRYLSGMVFFVVFFVAGCGAISLRSRWADAPIDITTTTSQLQENLMTIEDKPVLLSIMNDSNYLYIALVTSDRSIQRQIMARGFTNWFDRMGGDTKQFGVRFPLGMQPEDFQRMRDRWKDEGERPADDTRGSFMPPLDTTEADIMGPKLGEHERVKVRDLKQIAVKLFLTEDRVQYNLRVPLTDNGSQPYAIGTSLGSIIGVGFETATLEQKPQMKMGDDDEQGGMGGGMGGGWSRGGRMGQGDRGMSQIPAKRSEPINFWTTVQLAMPKNSVKE